MQKDTFYFQHDYEPTSDPKIQALIKQYDWMGYGLYWRIIEMMHSDPSHKLPKKNFIFVSLSSTKTTVETIIQFIESCIQDFELFITDGVDFWSNRVFKNIDKRNETIENKSKAGKASAEARKNSTPVQRRSTGVEQKATKERKGKEIKGKGRVFTPPIMNEVIAYFKENGFTQSYAERAFNFYNENDWMDSNEKKVMSWKSKMQSVWFKDENKIITKPSNYQHIDYGLNG